MTIHILTIADLRNGLTAGDLWPGGESVMPKHRAASYVANPRALDNDPALFVGMVDDDVGGHINVLSDDMHIDGASLHMGWLSAWWAAPQHRETGIGGMLLFKALSAWKNRIGISGFTEDARRVYDATRKFTDLAAFQGAVFENPGTMPDRPCTISDAVPDSPLWETTRQTFTRGREEFRWIASKPWILQSDMKNGGYPFSAYEARFRSLFIQGENSLFFCLLRGTRLKVKYTFYERAQTATGDLLSAFSRLGVESMEIHDKTLVESVGNSGTFGLSRPVDLTFLIAKSLLRGVADAGHVQPGDGDFVFT